MPAATPVEVRPGPELLRRVLLGLITALIVARPLVLGEDPGLIDRLSDASNLVLSLLWLVAAVGWAAWRAWSRQGTWYGSLVEAGLLVLVVLVGVSATTASYKHPAYLIAWEWLVLLAAFCLVRQLARTAGDNQRLLAAILASGVSVSAYAIYQYTVEMPAQRDALLANPERFSPALAQRIQEPNVYATFAHPNAFAGYLALLLPGMAGAFLVCARRQGWSWHTRIVGGCLVLTGIGLWLTHSRGAILGVLLIGALVVGGWLWTRRPAAEGSPPRWLLPGLLVLVVPVLLLGAWLLYGTQGFDLARQSLGKRVDYWTATWRMITDGKHPRYFWLGVGPGNFSRYYPQYMAPTAYEQVKDPHDFVLETWATSGVGAAVVLLATLGLFFWAVRGAWFPRSGQLAEDTAEADNGFATRWEFYLGGMAGMILGFILSSLAPSLILLSADDMLLNGVVAGCRAIVWFAVFALLETVPWTASARRLALTAGVAALLLNLTVSGGIAIPSVAQLLWVVAALALNTVPARPLAGLGRHWLGLVAPLPVLGAVVFLYYLFTFLPASRCIDYLSNAVPYYGTWSEWDREWQDKIKEGLDAKDRTTVISRNRALLDRFILPPLRKAVQVDPGNVHALTTLATWLGERWKLAPSIPLRENADTLVYLATTRIDPEGIEGYLTKYHLNLLFARFSETKADEFQDKAVQAMAEIVKRDPTNVHFRYQYIDGLMQTNKKAEARLQIQKAQELDRLATEPSRKLSDKEREQVAEWLASLTRP